MKERELVALMASTIYAGADDNQHAAGLTPQSAVRIARDILRAIDKGPDPFAWHEPEDCEELGCKFCRKPAPAAEAAA